MRRVELEGIAVGCGDIGGLAQSLGELARARSAHRVCCLNLHLLEEARRHDAVHAALATADLVVPDGAPVAWLVSIAIRSRVPRVTGSDLFRALTADSGGLRHFLFGATTNTLTDLEHAMRSANPGVEIAGALAPPFGDRLFTEVELQCDYIRATAPDVIWVGLGAPRQELWMQQAAALLDRGLFLGVGAVFDFVAGRRRRAPGWMQTAGLEWAHRLAQEPMRLAPRYVRTNAAFALRAPKILSRAREVRVPS